MCSNENSSISKIDLHYRNSSTIIVTTSSLSTSSSSSLSSASSSSSSSLSPQLSTAQTTIVSTHTSTTKTSDHQQQQQQLQQDQEILTTLSMPVLQSPSTITTSRPYQQHHHHHHHQHLQQQQQQSATNNQQHSNMSMLTIPPGLLPLDHYRLQLYNYAAMAERLRCQQQQQQQQYPGQIPLCPTYPSSISPYSPRLALSMSLFRNHVFQPEEPKPQHSYIGLIAMAILSSSDTKLVLSDIYQHILDNYPYFRTRGPGWRNSIRHNLSLNDCFIKAGRSANGKGHFWTIHPCNIDDFKKGDFRRRKAQRKVRKYMGLAVDDDGTDSPSPPPLSVTPPLSMPLLQSSSILLSTPVSAAQQQSVSAAAIVSGLCPQAWTAAAAAAAAASLSQQQHSHRIGSGSGSGIDNNGGTMIKSGSIYGQQLSRKRQFDVASLLAPDDDNDEQQQKQESYNHHHHHHHNHHFTKPISHNKRLTINHQCINDIDEDIDVVASDDQDDKDDSSHSQHLDDDNINNNDNNSWHGLMQQWPSNFTQFGVTNGMDPRILGRYYGQYMAAQQQQQNATTRRLSITNLSTSITSSSSSSTTNDLTTDIQQQSVVSPVSASTATTKTTNDC